LVEIGTLWKVPPRHFILQNARCSHTLPPDMSDTLWYYAVAGTQNGPVDDSDLQALVRAGTIQPATLVWREGMFAWEPYGKVAAAIAADAAGDFIPPADVISTIPATAAREVCVFAGFWIRLAAKLVDGIVMIAASFIIGFMMAPVSLLITPYIEDAVQTETLIFLLTYLVQVTVQAYYNIWFLARYGATPGKMACQLRVIRTDGSPLTTGRATGRFFAESLSGIILGIGYLMVAFDVEKRALHDHLADTRVIVNQPGEAGA
jgi:uncharacterized RDD family membrane protein YckC